MSQARFDRPRASAAGDVGQEGSASASARADHVHERESADANLSSTAGNISQVDVGDTAAAGALTTGARADHQHALPAPAAASTSAVGDSATTGSATTVARADHKHGREAFATTSDIADVAATESAGSAAAVARGDHVHALGSLGAWTNYTPTWAGVTVGNGSATGRYWQHGKTVHFTASLVWGSTTSHTGGTSSASLPVAASSSAVRDACYGWLADDSAGQNYPLLSQGVVASATTTGFLLSVSSNSANVFYPAVTATSPVTFAVGDIWSISGTYESA